MTDERARVQKPDHPITTEQDRAGVVEVAGRVIADAREAVTLRGKHPMGPVLYVLRKGCWT